MSNCNDTTTTKPTEVSNVIKADVNFTVLKGDTFDAVASFFDALDKPLNFTGATLLMHIRDSNDALVAGGTLQPGAGFTVSGNTISFSYIPLMSHDLYYYDLQCTFASGVKKTLIGGKFKVLKEITFP
jgi:hypothetical protein